MENIALYPGSFDPLTNGHIDLIQRGLCVFDKLIVGVARNPSKSPLFSASERVDIIREVASNEKVSVCQFDGLLVDFAQKVGAYTVIRGLRAVSDFEMELQMALINRKLSPKVETVFMMPNETYGYLSSSIVKEVASFGGDVSSFVHPFVEKKLHEKLKEKNGNI